MKVCLINNLYPPYARGGAEQVVYKTVHGLLRAGHQVVLITTSPNGKETVREGNLTIYRYRPGNLFFYTNAERYGFFSRLLWHGLDLFHLASGKFVCQVLGREKPDVVHTHNLMGMSFLIPHVIRRLGIRHLHTVHDVQLVEPSGIILKAKEHSSRYTGLPVRFYTAIMKRLFGSPSIVISPSQFLSDFYYSRNFFPLSKLVVVRNPLTMNVVSECASVSSSRIVQTTDNLVPAFQFLYVGQIESHKGVPFLVDAFRNFLLENPSAKVELHIVGSGTRLSDIECASQLTPQIILHGKMERDSLPDRFAQSDVTIVPSLCYENSPTVIFESLSFGVPVLASRIEGIAELIQEGENGFTFLAGNVQSLKEKLVWCLTHRQELGAMQNKTRASVQGLSTEEYIQTLVTLYRN